MLVYREPFRDAQLVAFGLIWAAVLLYLWDAAAQARARPQGRPG